MYAQSQYSVLRHLCWGMLLNHDPSRTWVVIMTEFSVYLDDSGHPDDQPFVIVAGYVSSESQWLAFQPEWSHTLNRFHLTEPFHMTDFMQERYTSTKRDQILSGLAGVTKRRTLWPFVSAVDMEAWHRVNMEFALDECIGSPYAIAARNITKQLHEWQSEYLLADDHLLLFVEEGTKHYGDLEQVFKRDRLPIPNRVPKTMAQVQPSDILAWEAFNYLKHGRMSKNLKRLTRKYRKQKEVGGIFFERDLRELCAKTDVIPRHELRPGDTIRFHSEKKRVRRRLTNKKEI